jgi:hypothetical protein
MNSPNQTLLLTSCEYTTLDAAILTYVFDISLIFN